MPIARFEMPDGRIARFEIPEGLSPDEAQNLISQQIPNLPVAPKEQTFMGRIGRATTSGLEAVGESAAGIMLGGKSALGMKESAGAQAEQIRKEAAAKAGEPAPISWDELEKTYGKEGAFAAIKKMPAYLAEQVLQSAPSMAIPLAAGAAAGAVSGPFAPITAPLAGIGTYGLQQFGQFMQRQAQEGATGETLAPGKAAVAAAVSAPVGYFADKLTLGFGKIPEKILGEQAAKELAKRIGTGVGARAATGATVGVIAEAPTEVLEQMAERWQAGLSLKGDDAMREYKEAFFGAAAVGGVGGAGSRALKAPPPVAKAPPVAEAPKEKPLELGMNQPFVPRALPDGSVANTQAELDAYEQQKFEQKYAPQKTEEELLALGMAEPFKPVVFPDGSVATTPEEVTQYEQQMFEKKYAAQEIPAETVEAPYIAPPSLTQEDIAKKLEGAPDEMASMLAAKRTEQEAKAEIPLADNYEFLQREKQRLMTAEQTPEVKSLIKRIEERSGEILAKDIERIRKDQEMAKTSAFGQAELPPVESREMVLGEKALGELQATEEPVVPMDRKEKASIQRFEKLQGTPAPLTEEEQQIAQAEKAAASIKSTNLRAALKGKLSPKEVYDIAPKGFDSLSSGTKRGTEISEMIADGLLNDYLPPAMHPGSSQFDAQVASEYIKDKLRTKENKTFDADFQRRVLENEAAQMSAELQKQKEAELALSELELPSFKRALPKGQNIGVTTTQDVVANAQRNWKNAPESVVAASMNDPLIPQEVRDYNEAQKKKGATGEPEGFFYKGKVYLIADQFDTPAAALKAYYHEALGHYGLRGVFGKDIEGVLTQILQSRDADVRKIAAKYGLDMTKVKDRMDAAEEVLTHMAQDNPRLPLVKRAIAAIRNWLREHGVNLKLSDNDIIQSMIIPAQNFVERGERKAVDGKLAAMRGESAPSWVPEKIWKLHELARRADDESEGRVSLRPNANGQVPKSGDLKRNQTMTFRRLNSAVDEYVGGDYQKSMDLMTRMNEESSSREDGAPEAEAGPTSTAFKKWFGDSKVVDANGNPLVVSHITKKKGVTTFDPKYKTELSSMGFHFGTPDQAEFRGKQYDFKARGEPEVGQYYLSIKKPLRVSHMASYAPDHLADRMMDMGMLDESDYADIQSEAGYDSVETGDRLVQILKDSGYDGLVYANEKEGSGASYVPFDATQIKSATGNVGTYSKTNPDIRYSRTNEPSTMTSSGQEAEDIMNSLGRVAEKELTAKEKFMGTYRGAMNDPQGTVASAKAAATKFLDKLETFTFSSDAALQNQIRREVRAGIEDNEVVIGKLLETSLSQTVHANAVSSLFLELGGVTYNKEIHKWEGQKNDATFLKMSHTLDKIVEKTGMTKARVEQMAHLAFEAKRLQSVEKYNAKIAAEVADMRADAAEQRRAGKPVAASALSDKAARHQEKIKTVHMERSQIAAAMELFKIHPELNEVVKNWNDIRANASKVMVESGLWSETEAEELLSNMDYVPFYREQDNIEGDNNFKSRTRSLMVAAKDKKFTGSRKPVNDIFENQIKWVEFAINRAVRNRSAVALANAAHEVDLATKVDSSKDAVRVWENGKEVFYKMDDPLFMDAFKGLEGVAIPTIKWAAKMTEILRNSVVLYPLFSISQIPQDAIAAIFTSGLKPQFALKIPVLAVKEFINTLNRSSATHATLKNVAAVGVRDFSAQTVRNDIAILAELKGKPGFWGNVKNSLNHFSMAADNAVRQATFIAAEEQGLSRGEAMEKSFEVFNARRKGSSKMLGVAGQLIPFFPAYLAAQHVAYKVITGRGISPQQRSDAYKTLAATTGSVMALSLLYAMMNGDDEDYLKKTTTMRDRVLMIPGTGGMSIPMRPDIFAFPKIITEHIYLSMTDKGAEDSRKFRDSMASALASAILGPTPVPQAIKPVVEVALNYNFFQNQPLVGTFQKGLETSRQFKDGTSELGKWIGSSGVISPIAADHLIRGMFGSVGGLVMFATNPFLHSDPEVSRPTLSMQEAIAAMPGTSGFVTKEYDNALKKDFYVLKEEVDKAAKTMLDIETRSPHKLREAYSDKELVVRADMASEVNAMAKELSSIHKEIAAITNSTMEESSKSKQIKSLNDFEASLLKSMGIKQMRAMAKL